MDENNNYMNGLKKKHNPGKKEDKDSSEKLPEGGFDYVRPGKYPGVEDYPMIESEHGVVRREGVQEDLFQRIKYTNIANKHLRIIDEGIIFGDNLIIANEIVEKYIPINLYDKKVFINPTFWRENSRATKKPTNSQAKTLYKNFVKDKTGQNFVFLLQRLAQADETSIHSHTSPEYIIQVLGNSYIFVSSNDFKENYVIDRLKKGEMIKIPSYNKHFLIGGEKDSITLPMKQTIKGKKDHFYLEKKTRDLEGAITAIKREILFS